jgi:hypothetical protein
LSAAPARPSLPPRCRRCQDVRCSRSLHPENSCCPPARSDRSSHRRDRFYRRILPYDCPRSRVCRSGCELFGIRCHDSPRFQSLKMQRKAAMRGPGPPGQSRGCRLAEKPGPEWWPGTGSNLSRLASVRARWRNPEGAKRAEGPLPNVVARDGIEPPTPAFSGLPSNSGKRLEMKASHCCKRA